MSIRIALLCAALALTASTRAQAAVWAWGCTGKLETSHVVFNRYSLVIIPATAVPAKLSEMIHRETLLKDGEPGDSYEALDGNSGSS
jgi:hypothetical protein